MSATTTHTTETTERKPPTIADIVREKTGDGRLIIDFFTDVMTGRIDGAELCHRIDAAKQLVKYGSKDAAEFLAKYKGVPCGHSINGRPDPADPCTTEERSLVAVTLNAPATLTRDFLTVLSGIDEFLMARLIRAQTADGGTIIEFLDDVMQDRTDGFKTHHRIAAAKELIVHIVRDEQPAPVPGNDSQGAEARNSDEPAPTAVVPAKSLPRTRYGAGTQWRGGVPSTAANPAHPEPSSSVIPAESLPRTRYGAGIQGRGGARSTAANSALTETVLSTAEGSAHPEPRQIVVPAESLPRTRYGAGTQWRGGVPSTAANPARTEPVEGPRPEFTEGPADTSSVVPAKEPAEEPALPSLPQLTTNNQQLTTLKQHWHKPDPWAAPIDSTTPGRYTPPDKPQPDYTTE